MVSDSQRGPLLFNINKQAGEDTTCVQLTQSTEVYWLRMALPPNTKSVSSVKISFQELHTQNLQIDVLISKQNNGTDQVCAKDVHVSSSNIDVTCTTTDLVGSYVTLYIPSADVKLCRVEVWGLGKSIY